MINSNFFLEKYNFQKSQNSYKSRIKFQLNFCLEVYLLNIQNSQHLTRLCITAHILEIERGGYKTREERRCTNKIEDEIHFHLHCKLFINDRQVLLDFMNPTKMKNFWHNAKKSVVITPLILWFHFALHMSIIIE